MARQKVVHKYNIGDTVKVKLEYATLLMSGFNGKSNIVKVSKTTRYKNRPYYYFEGIDCAGTPICYSEEWIEKLINPA